MEEERSSSSHTTFIILLMLGNLLTGTTNTIFAKWQSTIALPGPSQNYHHAYIQAASVFYGEILCLLLYLYIDHLRSKKYGPRLSPDEKAAVQRGLTVTYNPFLFAIPVVFAVISNALLYIGLANVRASVMQITMCTMIVWTALFSFFYLGRRYTPAQYCGLGMMVLGVLVVGLNSVLNNSQYPGENSAFGIMCIVLSMMLIAMFFVAEEKLLSKFYAPPLQVVGIEGTIGALVSTIALVIMYFVPCKNDATTCYYGRVEDVVQAFREIGSSSALAIAVISLIISLGAFNALGVTLTKNASATHRVAINAVRPFVVWLISILLGWESFSVLQLVGYLVAVYGMLLYYGLVPPRTVKIEAKREETTGINATLVNGEAKE